MTTSIPIMTEEADLDIYEDGQYIVIYDRDLKRGLLLTTSGAQQIIRELKRLLEKRKAESQ